MITTVFDPRVFDPGTYTSPSFAATPTARLEVTAIISDLDSRVPSLEIRTAVEGSVDASGGTWILLTSAVYHGGYQHEDGVWAIPRQGFGPPPVGIQRIRGVVDVNKRIQLGLDVSLT